MDWENERWVKLYTRNTAELVVIGWEARALLWELMRQCDGAGFIDTADPEELAVLCHMPSQHVTACHGTLLARGIIEEANGGLLIRNFLEAQDSRTSDKERKRRSRERQRLSKRSVTAGHSESQQVTFCHQEKEEKEEKDSLSKVETSDSQGQEKPDLRPLPLEAWQAADHLRDQILARWPENRLRTKAWKDGSPDRRRWADALELLSRIDGRPWQDIRQTVDWLFSADNSFVVQSPKALREKWDRIQVQRGARNGSRPTTQPLSRDRELT